MKNLMMIMTLIAIASIPVFVLGEEQGTLHSIKLPVDQPALKPGPGLDKVSTLCNICHSTDYITMQPAFSRATWTAEVNKMIKVMGAPINEEDAKTIMDYLVKNYGAGN